MMDSCRLVKTCADFVQTHSCYLCNVLSFEMFEEMLAINNLEIIKVLSKIKINKPEISEIITKDNNSSSKPNQTNNNISRNALCPCGSGKKYKRCCGKL